MDDSLEQPSALRYVETRTTTGERTPGGISDERLAEKLRYAEIAKAAYVKSGLNPEAELWGEDVSLLRELTALRASHKRLVDVLEVCCAALQRCYDVTEWPGDGSSTQDDALEVASPALADARKLEGK